MGEVFDVALYGAAGLLVLYALRVVFQKKDPEHPGAEARLGCGYFFLACALGGLASRDLVGGWVNAARLGTGVFLAAPALGALTKPHGSRLFLGVVGLFLSAFVAGPVVKDIWTGVEERIEGGPRLELEDAIAQMETRRDEIDGRLDDWRTRDLELRQLIKQKGFADFDALSEDPEGLKMLQELEVTQATIAAAEGEVAKLDAKIEEARAKLAQLEAAGAQAEEETELDLDLPDLSGDEYLTPVEEYVRQKELEALFEQEFTGK